MNPTPATPGNLVLPAIVIHLHLTGSKIRIQVLRKKESVFLTPHPGVSRSPCMLGTGGDVRSSGVPPTDTG